MASQTSPIKRSQIDVHDDLYEKQLESQKHKEIGDDVRKSVDTPITPLASDDVGITERDKSEYLQIQTRREEVDTLKEEEVITKQMVSVCT